VVRFKQEHAVTICDFNFTPGDLVLICNTAIEKALNCKMHPRYTGPLVVVSRNHSSAYILCKLNGTLAHSPFTAFRVMPYFACEFINIPDIKQHIDVMVAQLREMEESTNMATEDNGTTQVDTTPHDNEGGERESGVAQEDED